MLLFYSTCFDEFQFEISACSQWEAAFDILEAVEASHDISSELFQWLKCNFNTKTLKLNDSTYE